MTASDYNLGTESEGSLDSETPGRTFQQERSPLDQRSGSAGRGAGGATPRPSLRERVPVAYYRSRSDIYSFMPSSLTDDLKDAVDRALANEGDE